MLDSPDALVDIVERDSADAQAAAVEHAMASGVYLHVIELVEVSFKATRIGQLNERQ